MSGIDLIAEVRANELLDALKEREQLRARVAELDAENERLLNAARELADEWRAFRYTGYVPPEDGSAGEYAESAMHDCGRDLARAMGLHGEDAQ